MLLKQQKAFTLIELLAVVMIIAIMTAVAVPQYRSSIQQAQASEALINLRTIFDAAVRYKALNNAAPTSVTQLDVSFFDAQVSGNVSYIGKFAYTFANTDIKACYIDGNNSTNTYCFTAYYNHATNGRGAMFCTHAPSWGAKFAKTCKPFCSSAADASGVCSVNEIPD